MQAILFLTQAVTYIPDYELVVILTAKRSQILFVGGESEALDQHLVHFETMHHLEVVEVPDYDISLNTASTQTIKKH